MTLTLEQRGKVRNLLIAIGRIPDPGADGSSVSGAGTDACFPTPSPSVPAAIPTSGAAQIADVQFQMKMESRK